MGITVYLFFGLLIAITHGANPNEDRNLGTTNSTSEFTFIDQNEQQDEDDVTEQLPSFVRKNKMAEVQVKPVGNMATFRCKADGVPTPNVTWYKNNKVPERHLGTIRYGQWSLTLEDLVADDAGNYTCVVCNVVGCIDFSYTLNVVERYPSKPYIKDGYPRNVTALVNSTASLECPQIIADLEPYLQWIKPTDYPIEFSNDTIPKGIVLQDGVGRKNPHLLEIRNVTHESEGWYTCVAANTLGFVNASAYLEVIDSVTSSLLSSSTTYQAYQKLFYFIVYLFILTQQW